MSAPKTKIFVGHLPDGCSDDDLRALFEKYGEVTECDVINKYGFVHMATTEQADEAVKMLNNYNLMGSTISVEPSKSKLHPEPGAPGRANKQTVMSRRGGQSRNGFGGPPRGGYGGGYPNGFGRRFDGPPMGDNFYDRPFGFGRERMRPYPSPYDRRSPPLPMRDEYPRRPMPPMASDPYARPMPRTMRDELYERRPMPEHSDYLYSRRSPPPMSSMRVPETIRNIRKAQLVLQSHDLFADLFSLPKRSPYWYDSVSNGSSRVPPPAANRRPAYF